MPNNNTMVVTMGDKTVRMTPEKFASRPDLWAGKYKDARFFMYDANGGRKAFTGGQYAEALKKGWGLTTEMARAEYARRQEAEAQAQAQAEARAKAEAQAQEKTRAQEEAKRKAQEARQQAEAAKATKGVTNVGAMASRQTEPGRKGDASSRERLTGGTVGTMGMMGVNGRNGSGSASVSGSGSGSVSGTPYVGRTLEEIDKEQGVTRAADMRTYGKKKETKRTKWGTMVGDETIKNAMDVLGGEASEEAKTRAKRTILDARDKNEAIDLGIRKGRKVELPQEAVEMASSRAQEEEHVLNLQDRARRIAEEVSGIGRDVASRIGRGEQEKAGLMAEASKWGVTSFGDAGRVIAAAREGEKRLDPEKLTEELIADLPSRMNGYLKERREDIERDAKIEGVSVESYLENYVAPALAEQIGNEVFEQLVQRQLPKNQAQYLMQSVERSIIGNLAHWVLDSDAQQQVLGEAYARQDSGQGVYKPGTAGQLVGVGLGFAADVPVMGAVSKVVGAVSPMSRSVVASQSLRLANGSVGRRIGVGVLDSALQGWGNFGFYNMASTYASNLATDQHTTVGMMSDAFVSGAPGALIGATGRAMNNIFGRVGVKGTEKTFGEWLQNASKKVAVGLASFEVEAASFTLGNWLMGQGELTIVDNIEDQMELVAMKIGGALGHVGKGSGKSSSRERLPGGIKGAMGKMLKPSMEIKGRLSDDVKWEIERASDWDFWGYVDDIFGMKEKIAKESNPARKQAFIEQYKELTEELSWDAENALNTAMWGVAASKRPRVAYIKYWDESKVAFEVDKDGKVLSSHRWETQEDLDAWESMVNDRGEQYDAREALNLAIMTEINRIVNLPADSREFAALADQFIAENGDEDVSMTVRDMQDPRTETGRLFQMWLTDKTRVNEVLEAAGLSWEDVERLMNADVTELRDSDMQTLNDLYWRLNNIAFDADELNPAQAGADGRKIAEEAGAGSGKPDAERIAALSAEVDKAAQDLEAWGKGEGGEVMQLWDMDDPWNSYITLRQRGYTEEQTAPIARYLNAVAKQEAFMEAAEGKIEENAERWVNLVGGASVVVVTDKTGKKWYVKGGEYGVVSGKVVTLDEAGLLCVDDEGNVRMMRDDLDFVAESTRDDAMAAKRKELEDALAAVLAGASGEKAGENGKEGAGETGAYGEGEAERKAKEEAERKAKEEAERKAREEAERKAMEEAERKAREEEARRQAEEEARRKAEEEARAEEERLKAEREAKEKAEQEAKKKAAEQEYREKTRKALDDYRKSLWEKRGQELKDEWPDDMTPEEMEVFNKLFRRDQDAYWGFDKRYRFGWDGDYSKWLDRREYLDEVERKEKEATEAGRFPYYLSTEDGYGQRDGGFTEVWLTPEEAKEWKGRSLWTRDEAQRSEEGFQVRQSYYSLDEYNKVHGDDAREAEMKEKEAIINADEEATEDEKLTALEYLRGESTSDLDKFVYDSIMRRHEEKTGGNGNDENGGAAVIQPHTEQKGEELNAEEQADSRNFDLGMKAQEEIHKGGLPRKKPGEMKMKDMGTGKNDAAAYSKGVHHDEGGYGVVTDGTYVYFDHGLYDEGQKGKTISVGSDKNYPEGTEVSGRYPNWRSVLPTGENRTYALNPQELAEMAAGIESVVKANWQKKDKDKRTTFAEEIGQTKVFIRLGDGRVIAMKLNGLKRFAQAAQRIGATEMQENKFKGSVALYAKTDEGGMYALGTDVRPTEEGAGYGGVSEFYLDLDAKYLGRKAYEKPEAYTGRERPVSENGGTTGADRPKTPTERAAEIDRERRKEKADEKGGSLNRKEEDQARVDAAAQEVKNLLQGWGKKFIEAGLKNDGELSINFSGLNKEQWRMMGELLRVSTKLGYELARQGYHKFEDWARQMAATIGDALKSATGWNDDDVKDFCGQLWEQRYTDEGKNRKKISEHASDFEKKSLDLQSGSDLDKEAARKEARNQFVVELGKRLTDGLDPLTMKEARQMAKERGLDDFSDVDLQELVETATVMEAKKIVSPFDADGRPREITKSDYDKVVALYERQPKLNKRDSDRVEKQQYSTPVPMSVAMAAFARSKGETRSVLEPSAGNGALTIGFAREDVHVNEIDEMRSANLRSQGFGKVTSQDGRKPFAGKYDVVVTNPPFSTPGAVLEPMKRGEFKLTGLDGQMAVNALDSMKDDGRAAIIIGGHTKYDDYGVLVGKDRQFLGYLYQHYNVVDVINMGGKLYGRNGTEYPTRMILIDGRRKDSEQHYAPVKEKARAEAVETFDDLWARIEEAKRTINEKNDVLQDPKRERDGHGDVVDEGKPETGRVGDGERDANDAGAGDSVRPPRGDKEGDKGLSPERGPGRLPSDDRPVAPEEDSGRPGGRGGLAVGPDRGDTGRDGGGLPPRADDEGRGLSAPVGDGRGDGEAGGGRPRAAGADADAVHHEQPVSLDAEKVDYVPRSEGRSLGTKIPANLQAQVRKMLARIGDVDEYVRKFLGYGSKEQMWEHLGAEQIDAVAGAIYQMEQGKGFIIGDGTGVGKGRQAAALLRYGMSKGKVPIFVTQKSELFADIYRDMKDIGFGDDFRPLIINASDKKVNIYGDADPVTGKEKLLYRGLVGKGKAKEILDYLREHGELPPYVKAGSRKKGDEQYNCVLLTYSQVAAGTTEYIDGKPKARDFGDKKPASNQIAGEIKRELLKELAIGNIVVLDESHTAAGAASGYFMNVLGNAEGVTFLSGTFAKRPDSMPLYAQKTAIADASDEKSDVIAAVKVGGVTLQEVMSQQLVEAGQMIRRERPTDGVVSNWVKEERPEYVEREHQKANTMAEIFRSIIEFQRTFVEPYLEQLRQTVRDIQASVGQKPGKGKLGIGNTPFASKAYNLVRQLSLALKVETAADHAIAALKAGRKPIITVANTMEGFLDKLPIGEAIDMPDLAETMLRGLESSLEWQQRNRSGKVESTNIIPLKELGPEAEAEYLRIEDLIKTSSSGLVISPIDAMTARLEAEGYKVGELTGRKEKLQIDPKTGKVTRMKRTDTDKKVLASRFNNGGLDVLIINKSSATGISLHSSTSYKDTRQREMIIAQLETDINDAIQLLGRINRTGCVWPALYTYLQSTVPAEGRLLMMYKAKLKSLQANTAGDQENKDTEVEAVDILNKYGDQVVAEYFAENIPLYVQLGDPFKKGWTESTTHEQVLESLGDISNLDEDGAWASKTLSYIAMLPVEEQTRIVSEIEERYNTKIEILNEAGENTLVMNNMPLRAKLLRKSVARHGKDPSGDNPFAGDTYAEEVECDVLVKPMTSDQVNKAIGRNLDGKSPEETRDALLTTAREYRDAKIEKVRAKYEARIEKEVDAAVKRSIREQKKAYKEAVKKAKEEGAPEPPPVSEERMREIAEIDGRTTREHIEEVWRHELEIFEQSIGNVVSVLKDFPIGRTVSIPIGGDTSGVVRPSKVLGYKIAKNHSPYSSTVTFATCDGRRKVTVQMSDTEMLNTIRNESEKYDRDLGTLGQDANWDQFAKGVKSREVRTIYTGNIIPVLGEKSLDGKPVGRIVRYTTDTGEVKVGVLLPQGVGARSFDVTPINKEIDKIRAGEEVESADGEVSIKKKNTWRGAVYELRVPRSTEKGKKYFLDPSLRELIIGRNFETKGGQMVAEIEERNLGTVLDLLSARMGVTVAKDRSEGSGADGSTRMKVEDGGEERGAVVQRHTERGRTGADAGAERVTASRRREIDAARRKTKELERRHGVKVRMVERLEDVDNADARKALEAGHKVTGWYDEKTGEVCFYEPNIRRSWRNPTVEGMVERLYLHEVVAHKGLPHLLGKEGFDKLCDEVWGMMERNLGEKDLARALGYAGVAEIGDETKKHRAAADEYMAKMAEGGVERSIVDRVIGAVRRMLRKMGFKVEFTDRDILDMLGRAKRNLEREQRERMKGEGTRFSTSKELDERFGPRWIEEQTNSDGRHTTQVKNTVNSYRKFGEWVKKVARGKKVSILDASSGLGIGTEWMRGEGMDVDDVEPYPSSGRKAPTFKSYADITKKYDYIISNAVLNVIPDDWRSSLLHDMAGKLKDGGKLVVNVRGAQSIINQGKEGETRITLDTPSEILVLRPDGSIKAYQKGFTKQELKEWCEKELGEGYSVEIANNNNAGGSYDTAVVITKNNISTAKSSAYGLGLPTQKGAPMANVNAKLSINAERNKRLNELLDIINIHGAMGAHELLHEIAVSFNTSLPKEKARIKSTAYSEYYDLGNGVTLRIANHQGNANTFARRKNYAKNYGLVIKLSPYRFKDEKNVDYLEYVYYPDKLEDAERQKSIIIGLQDFIATGDFSKLPKPDRVNPSGKFKNVVKDGSPSTRLHVEEMDDAGDPLSTAGRIAWEDRGKRGSERGDVIHRHTGRERTDADDAGRTGADWEETDGRGDNVSMGKGVGERLHSDDPKEREGMTRFAIDEYDTIEGIDQKVAYEERLREKRFAWREAWVDRLRSLKELVTALTGKEKMEDVLDAHNVWAKATRLGSVVQALGKKLDIERVKPLQRAVDKCIDRLGGDRKEAYDLVHDYIWMKSALERNRVLYVRDWIERKRKAAPASYDDLHDEAKAIWNNMRAGIDTTGWAPADITAMENRLVAEAHQAWLDDVYSGFVAARRKAKAELDAKTIDLEEFYEQIDGYIKGYSRRYKPGGKNTDYSALSTAVTTDDKGNHDYKEAIREVTDMEDELDGLEVDLWKEVNALTKWTLDKTYDSGLQSKKMHDHIDEMMDWYVPMRLWDETTAEDVNAYYRGSTHADATSITKRANGRSSREKDVFVVMLKMAHDAILKGETNKVKQSLYRLVHDTKSDGGLVSISEYWEERSYDASGNEVWTPKYAETTDEMTGDEVAKAVKDFGEEMTNKALAGDARKAAEGLYYPLRFERQKHKNEHTVEVSVGGKKYLLYVNGSPRAAQALNGDLSADPQGTIVGGFNKLNRYLAAVFTAWNPEFTLRNLFRDFDFATTNTFAKEGAGATARWLKNWVVSAAITPGMWRKLGKGELGDSPNERLLREFWENGGKTGYVNQKHIDEYEKDLHSALKLEGMEGRKRVIKALGRLLEGFNNWAENVARFATYKTSREMGRTILRSVMDAKDISTNFNRKGAYQATMKNAKTRNAKWAGATAEVARDLWVFLNPGIQSLSLLSHNFRKHPARTSVAYATHFALGMVWPYLMGQWVLSWFGDDDETNKYENIPAWERDTHMCFYAGKGNWVKLPLSIETAAAWQLGQMVSAHFLGHDELKSGLNPVLEFSSALTSVVPVDPLASDGESLVLSMMPTVVAPMAQHLMNKKWTGVPIEKDAAPWNKNDARWTRAFNSVNPLTLGVCKWLSDLTSEVGNSEVMAGWLDMSPGVIENYLKGYTGGAGGFVMDVAKFGKGLTEGKVEAASMPLFNGLYTRTDSEAEMKRVNARYYKVRDTWEKRKAAMKKAEKKAKETPTDTSAKIDLERKYGEALRRYAAWEKRLNTLYKLRKRPATAEEAERIEQEITDTRKKIIDELG